MKRILFTLLCVFAASAVGWNRGLLVRFGIGLSGYFIELPQFRADAVSQSWTQATRPDATAQILPSLTLYCHGTYIVCVLYDDTDFVAGLQIAFPADEYTDAVYDWEAQGFSNWTVGDKIYRTITQYYVNEVFLATNADERVANRRTDTLLQAGSVWVTGNNGDIMQIKNDADSILERGFTQQACIPLMGRHYYYNMTTDLECNELMYPWFPLTDRSGEMIAMGLITYGKFEEQDEDFFERPNETAVRLIVPEGPECLYSLASDPGLVTMHIYYVDAPLLIWC